MTNPPESPIYHPLYLGGIERFNHHDYFESHERWESLWKSEAGPARSFYKGLIQAAVALYHLSRGNAHGAQKLLRGSERYLAPYRPYYLGLDVDRFVAALRCCVRRALAGGGVTMAPGSAPEIHLQPAPTCASSTEERR